MIQEAYVSFEIAKLLKEKGFQQLQDNCGYFTTEMVYSINVDKNGEHHFAHQYPAGVYNKDKYIAAPTHQMACAWLREVHLIHIYAEYKAFFQEKPKKMYYHWMPFVRTLPNCPIYNSGFPNYLDIYCDSHEEAVEAALKYTLENLL